VGRLSAHELVGIVPHQGVLTLSRLGVVSPPGRALSFASKVVGGEVLTRTVLSSPSLTEGVNDEITDIEISMGLVTSQESTSHGDKRSVALGPARPHRSPSITLVVKVSVEREVGPPSTFVRGVVPEHAPRLGGIGVVSLVKGVSRLVELLGPEEERVGSGRELVGTVVTIVELGGQSLVVNVEHAGQVPLRSRLEQSLVVTVSGDECGDHLGGTGGSKVPVVGSLGPGPVIPNRSETVGLGVVGSVTQDGLSGSGSVLVDNGKGSHGKSTVDDTVPVSSDGVSSATRPPSVDSVGIGSPVVHLLTKAQTESDDPASDLGLLLVRPNRVQPIVGDSVSGAELGDIEEMLGVPSGVAFSKVTIDASGVLQLSVSPIDPGGIVGHLVSISPVLDSDLELSSDIQHSASAQSTVNVVSEFILVSTGLSVGHDGLVPLGEVGVLSDQARSKCLPLVSGGKKTRVSSGRGSGGRFGVGRPSSGSAGYSGRRGVARGSGLIAGSTRISHLGNPDADASTVFYSQQ
jgi:hypothetical protein